MTAAVDAASFANISATTSAFKGGYYVATVVATFGGGSVDLQMFGPDDTTWLSTPTAIHFTAAGAAASYLPPGQFRFAVTIATAVYARVDGVPISWEET